MIQRRLTCILLCALLAASALPAKDSKRKKKDRQAREEVSETVDTPFGPAARTEEKPEPSSDQRVDAMVDVEVRGSQVTFRRQTPFGVQTWTRSKADLSDGEKQLLKDSAAAKKKRKSKK